MFSSKGSQGPGKDILSQVSGISQECMAFLHNPLTLPKIGKLLWPTKILKISEKKKKYKINKIY